MQTPAKQVMALSTGASLSYLLAGDQSKPAVLLLHGFPSSSRTFRDVIPALSEVAFIIAPDMPGFGESDVPRHRSFQAITDAMEELLDHLSVRARFIYLHDYGAPAGLRVAMHRPDLVLGLIVQNANAHLSGLGPPWDATKEFWAHPTAETEREATAHLTAKGTRDQYVAQVPQDIVAKISPQSWEQDWRVMQLPGRIDMQRALVADYGNHVAHFEDIAAYLEKFQPPALMLWGRHDSFFDLDETVSWMRALPRMEAHILDAGHFVLETEAPRAARLMIDFITRIAFQHATTHT